MTDWRWQRIKWTHYLKVLLAWSIYLTYLVIKYPAASWRYVRRHVPAIAGVVWNRIKTRNFK